MDAVAKPETRNNVYNADFFSQNACVVARQLLGARLVRTLPDGTRLSGQIVETEAYTGHDDMASHGRLRQTPRNLPMWGEPGRAYVYLSRGVHWMLNVVAEPKGQPAAVLIRALVPLEGLEHMAARRAGRKQAEWTSGPGRLCVALDVTKAHNTIDLTTPHAGLWIEPMADIPDARVLTSARIGMGKTPEPWFSMPWRWYVANNPYVSRGK
jgi:DNA-3-methyladenine glycosylase